MTGMIAEALPQGSRRTSELMSAPMLQQMRLATRGRLAIAPVLFRRSWAPGGLSPYHPTPC
jgi:hypothetical protein